MPRPLDADNLVQRIRETCPGRSQGGLTQAELADRASVSQTTISRILHERWDECSEALIAQVREALDLPETGDPQRATREPPAQPPRHRTRSARSPSPDLDTLVNRDLNSAAQRRALDDLRHLLRGRPGMRISWEELIGALVVVQNERLDVSVLELLRSLHTAPSSEWPG